MYSSLFPLRLKQPWHPGISSLHDSKDDAANGLTWLRGDNGERGLQSMNFQGFGVGSWMQRRLDLPLLGNEHDQQYQALAAASLQEIRSGDPLKQQYMQFQQPLPFQYQQQSCGPNQLLQQQMIQQSLSQQIVHEQAQNSSDHQPRHLVQPQLLQKINGQQKQQPQQQQQTYQEAFQISNDHLQQQQATLSAPLCQKPDFTDSNITFSAAINPSCMQSMLGSLCPEGSGNLMNFPRIGQSMLREQQQQQSWVPKFAFSQANTFGLLLPTSVPNLGTSSIDADVSSIPFGASGLHSPLYGCMDDSSDLLHTVGQVDPQTKTFVKVYKSGSVGRSLDITRFNSYHELIEELGQMFSIEGPLDDPLRSGWQLVFVDRENDILLLGDDPWEAFVNNVWYIKILSPEDVKKLGKQGAEAISPNGGQMLSNGGCDGRNLASGMPPGSSCGY
ncbi:auxin response factor 8-like isoform X2 [Macadamia integrifolia]|uniref:auxin response factor 8-like isoform X2 n=1 Tax=Macadamia integrifolia TaxID=60698 RepID=UPI001C4E94C4|nr:auxin response factor 8-like isoform X2 [Macadamia integrifolia]